MVGGVGGAGSLDGLVISGVKEEVQEGVLQRVQVLEEAQSWTMMEFKMWPLVQ